MYKDYDDIVKHMEFEMKRCSAEAMRRLLELPADAQEFWLPRADVYETGEELVVRVEVAGIQRESLNVSLSADSRVITIRGTRSEQFIDERPKLRYHQLEVYFGPFERDVLLPRDLKVDSERVEATYHDGFLVVTLPKIVKPTRIRRSIPIESAEEDISD